jgi:hypothetical protein
MSHPCLKGCCALWLSLSSQQRSRIVGAFDGSAADLVGFRSSERGIPRPKLTTSSKGAIAASGPQIIVDEEGAGPVFRDGASFGVYEILDCGMRNPGLGREMRASCMFAWFLNMMPIYDWNQ